MNRNRHRRRLMSFGLLAILAACGGSTTTVGAGDGGTGTDGGSGGGCTGLVPACAGANSAGCCVGYGSAVCVNNAWACPSGGEVGGGPCTGCDGREAGGLPDGQVADTSVDASCGPPPPGPRCLCGTIQCINGQWVCPTDCDGGGGNDAGGSTPCGNAQCGPGAICVVQNNGGGACLPVPDSGVCPPNYVLQGDCCVFSMTTYTCQPLPGSCNGTLSCGCASQLCQCMCVGASGNELDCVCAFP